jgi:hypothetical protein
LIFFYRGILNANNRGETIMKTQLNRIISALLIAIVASANVSQTVLAEQSPKPTATFTPPSFCPDVGDDPSRTVLFTDNMESTDAKWSYGFDIGSVKWAFATPGISGSKSLFGQDPTISNSSWAVFANPITLLNDTTYYLYFKHQFNLDFSNTYQVGYDGAVLEYSLDGGSNWIDARPLFSAGQDYNVIMGNRTALGSRAAFSGSSGGIVASRYSLSSLAGKTVTFRWWIVTDSIGGGTGWYVDDVEVYTCPSNMNVFIGGNLMESYNLASGNVFRKSYVGINSGPARVKSLASSSIITSQRVVWGTGGYDELMGFPADQLTTEYVFPYYNNTAMSSQLRIGNVGDIPAFVEVYIGGDKQTIPATDPNPIPVGGSLRLEFAGVNKGPVRVLTTTVGAKIISTERVIWGNLDYDELMGFPADQLTTEYVFPYYNNTAMSSQLRIGNVGDIPAFVEVYIGGDKQTIPATDPNPIPVGGSLRLEFAGVNKGPVRVLTTTVGAKIISTERVIWGGSGYDELMGFPANKLTTEYGFPLYSNVGMSGQLRIGNVGNSPAFVEVYIGGIKQTIPASNPNPIPVGGSLRLEYSSIDTGPVYVKTTTAGAKIITTIRAIRSTGYDELLGRPYPLAPEYLFPWYNNTAMSSQVNIAIP